MKIIFSIILVIIAIFVVYQGFRIFKLAQISKQLITSSVPFEQLPPDSGQSVLVIGDSVGYGVGSSHSETSFVGFIGQAFPSWEIVNHSESGREIRQALLVLESVERSDWDLIILQISGNDIFHLNNLEKSKTDLKSLFKVAKSKSDQVVFVTTGSIGHAPLIPQPFDWLYSKLSEYYIYEFVNTAKENGVIVVNNYRSKANDIFEADPDKYYSADKFHPSSAGYKVWFDNLKLVLDQLDFKDNKEE